MKFADQPSTNSIDPSSLARCRLRATVRSCSRRGKSNLRYSRPTISISSFSHILIITYPISSTLFSARAQSLMPPCSSGSSLISCKLGSGDRNGFQTSLLTTLAILDLSPTKEKCQSKFKEKILRSKRLPKLSDSRYAINASFHDTKVWHA